MNSQIRSRLNSIRKIVELWQRFHRENARLNNNNHTHTHILYSFYTGELQEYILKLEKLDLGLQVVDFRECNGFWYETIANELIITSVLDFIIKIWRVDFDWIYEIGLSLIAL